MRALSFGGASGGRRPLLERLGAANLRVVSMLLTRQGYEVEAADTGHKVFSTLHTIDATETVNRIVDFFPPHQQHQIRVALAGSIKGTVCQRLVPTVGSMLAFTAYVWLLRAAPTSLVATYAYMNPIVAVILGWALLGDGGREAACRGR